MFRRATKSIKKFFTKKKKKVASFTMASLPNAALAEESKVVGIREQNLNGQRVPSAANLSNVPSKINNFVNEMDLFSMHRQLEPSKSESSFQPVDRFTMPRSIPASTSSPMAGSTFSDMSMLMSAEVKSTLTTSHSSASLVSEEIKPVSSPENLPSMIEGFTLFGLQSSVPPFFHPSYVPLMDHIVEDEENMHIHYASPIEPSLSTAAVVAPALVAQPISQSFEYRQISNNEAKVLSARTDSTFSDELAFSEGEYSPQVFKRTKPRPVYFTFSHYHIQRSAQTAMATTISVPSRR